MPRRLNLPDSASVAQPGPGGRLHAPSAARNAEAITACATAHAPTAPGPALELASGTGQHVVALARALPHLAWQPSEIDAERRRSIDAHVAAAGLGNVAPARTLDATAPGWAAELSGQSFILLVNLLHLVSDDEARTLLGEAAAALRPGGVLMIYGPFKRGQDLTSAGDRAFDASLRAQDPEIGYKNDGDLSDWASTAGLAAITTVEMPANNLAFLWRRPV
ncbi:DUF938 domain-containing protein [Shimia sp.]|uniref:DUF938 domain-containing protein n=1 Tax=Shimia sp. TaxID=1954381 RepID=UPI0035654752